MGRPAKYMVQLTKRGNGKFGLKLGGQATMLKADLQTLGEVVRACSLLLNAAAIEEEKCRAARDSSG